MSAMSRVCDGLEPVVRWLARGLSLLAVGMVMLFAAGMGIPNPMNQPPAVVVSLSCFLGIVLGLVAAWRREALGAAVSVLSFAGFQAVELVVNRRPALNGAFLLLAAPGVLFLLASALGVWKERRSRRIAGAI